jgi:uncharacterized protein
MRSWAVFSAALLRRRYRRQHAGGDEKRNRVSRTTVRWTPKSAAGIDRQGGKGRAAEALFEWTQDQIHLGAFDIPARIDVMNDSGIHAQICFPNSIGLGGQGISDIVKDPVLRLLCVQIYNDAMAEVQADSGRRLLPMPVLPAWDVDEAVAEAKRVASKGVD